MSWYYRNTALFIFEAAAPAVGATYSGRIGRGLLRGILGSLVLMGLAIL